MPFAVAAAGIGVVGSIVSSQMQSDAISEGQDKANAALQAGRDQARHDLAPWADTGSGSLTRQADILGLHGQDAADAAMSGFQTSPGYEYNFKQALRGVDAGAASIGLLRSGATIKAEEEKASNLANNEFGNYISRLNALSTLGENAAAGQANASTGAAANTASVDTNAAGQQAKIAGNEVSGITNSLTGALSSSGGQNALSGFFQPSGSSIYGDTAISNPNVAGGSYFSNANPNANF